MRLTGIWISCKSMEPYSASPWRISLDTDFSGNNRQTEVSSWRLECWVETFSLYDKYEYYDLYHSVVADNIDFWIEETPADVLMKGQTPKITAPYITKMTKKQTIMWMNMTSEYSAELNNLGKKAACDTTLLEMVCCF